MNFGKILYYFSGLFLVFLLSYITACDSRGGASNPVSPPNITPNPYGNGNGKITFYRTQQIAGNISIKIGNISKNDSIIWQTIPNCDTNISVSYILQAGNYSARIEGDVFLCNYNFQVEERVCKRIEYTNCANGYVGCYYLDGTWVRTADGPCPNCQGLKIQFSNGIGEVLYTPPGCRFPIGDTKWKDFNFSNCSMSDLARDQFGGSPKYETASLTFFKKDSINIIGPSGIIPYQRISITNDKKIFKSNNNIFSIPPDSVRLQTAN